MKKSQTLGWSDTIKKQVRWQKPQGPKSTLILEKVCLSPARQSQNPITERHDSQKVK